MAHRKHTPGPWTPERTRLDGHEWFVRSDCRNLPPYNWLPRLKVMVGALVPLNGKRYVDASSGSASSDQGCCETAITEARANAHLIAASPDLFEALCTKRDYVADAASGALTYDGSKEGFRAMAREDLARIDAAIAKAEGR